MYVSIDLNTVQDGTGKTVYIEPNVNIGIDIKDNVDVSKLRDFQLCMNSYIRDGLNSCLVK